MGDKIFSRVFAEESDETFSDDESGMHAAIVRSEKVGRLADTD